MNFAKNRVRTTALSVFFLLLFACGHENRLDQVAAEITHISSEKRTDEQPQPSHAPTQVIKEGHITFETHNMEETRVFLTTLVDKLEGYIAHEHMADQPGKTQSQITIRVPARHFELLVERISSHSSKVDHKTIQALDVSDQFYDLKTRIKTKKELENRFSEILRQATTVSDILAIEKEMRTLRTQIESYEGRLQRLQNRISYSTMHVNYYQTTDSSKAYVNQLVNALSQGWHALLSFLLILVYIWPFLLIGLAIWYFLRRRKKTRLQKK